MDDHVHTLGLLACSTPEARKAVAKLSPASHADDESSRPHAKRFDLN
jgi:hypothetical protein